ncbi:MAG: PDZ domain-containing protein [Myxococcota bacterium]|nr:PDZ domain-containing protein [Myxococcota bacterium]
MLRAQVERRLASERGVTVVGVVAGGGFDRAGIQRGDRLRRLNGRRIRSADDFAREMLESADRASIAIEYERGGEAQRVVVSPAAACPIRLSLGFKHALTTYQPIRLHVSVPIELVQTVERDLLASVVAHEIAHALFDVAHESKAQQEQRADREGLMLAARAGYDVSGMAEYWERVAVAYPWTIEAAFDGRRSPRGEHSAAARDRELLSHDDIARRLPTIRKYIAGIQAQLAESPGEASNDATNSAEAHPPETTQEIHP